MPPRIVGDLNVVDLRQQALKGLRQLSSMRCMW